MRRGGGSRTPSGPWGRLKPVEQDPLEAIGLPSKGDTRLLDFKAQEKYYTKIVERYMTFCTDAGKREELQRRFTSVAIEEAEKAEAEAAKAEAAAKEPQTGPLYGPDYDSKILGYITQPTPPEKPTKGKSRSFGRRGPPVPASTEGLQSNTKALSDVLMALRKLREGIVASKRTDDFAIQVYLFCIRLAIIVKQPEAYHPAILHLLRTIHPIQPLTSLELQEVVGYLILDTACRRKELEEAYAIRMRHGKGARGNKVDAVLAALARDDYFSFRRLMDTVDGHRAKLMEWAEPDMRLHTLKCFGRTYMSADLRFLEAMTGSTWEKLVEEDSVGWVLDGNRVVIRKPKEK